MGAEKGPLAEAHMVMVQLEVLQGEEGQEESQNMVPDCHNQILNNHKQWNKLSSTILNKQG